MYRCGCFLSFFALFSGFRHATVLSLANRLIPDVLEGLLRYHIKAFTNEERYLANHLLPALQHNLVSCTDIVLTSLVWAVAH